MDACCAMALDFYVFLRCQININRMDNTRTAWNADELKARFNPEGSLLRRQQLVMLDMVNELDRICRKYDIPYFLYGGTLLGAIRHNGFIPWDDDLDVGLMRKDYQRLMKVLPDELPPTKRIGTISISSPSCATPVRSLTREPMTELSTTGVFSSISSPLTNCNCRYSGSSCRVMPIPSTATAMAVSRLCAK